MIFYRLSGLITILLFSSCVSQTRFWALETAYNNASKSNRELLKKNDSLQTTTNQLQQKNETITATVKRLQLDSAYTSSELEELTRKYTVATRTSEYYHQEGFDYLEEKKPAQAYSSFLKAKRKQPGSHMAIAADKELNKLEQESHKQLNRILTLAQKETLVQNKIAVIDREQEQVFLSESDKDKLRKKYVEYTKEYEAERYITVEDDKMQSCYFYETSRNTFQQVSGVSLNINIYIVKNYSGRKNLRIRSKYGAESWMFYKSIAIRGSKGTKVTIQTDYPEKKTDNDSYGVREWSDNPVNTTIKNKLIKIAQSENIFVRFDGKYRYDMMLNEEQLKAFKEIIKKYKKI